MADMELAVQGQSQSSVAPSQVESPKVESSYVSAPTSEPKQSERQFTQSDVDRIVGKTREQLREEYYNRGKQEALAEYNKQQTPQQTMGGINQVSPEEIDKIVEQKLTERAQTSTANQIAQDFIGKLQSGKDKYSDFEETVAQLNLPSHPHVIYWANSLDNTVDVVYDLAKYPEKFASVLMLSQSAPELARRKMLELSQSIKANEEARKEPHVNEPLSQLKPSTVGTDNGSMTVKDLRKQPWLRG